MIEKTEKEIMKNWEGDIHNPIVSVCCITYNHEKYIEEAIDSFLMQETNFPFEIVIGEDCSTDSTKKIIEKYALKYPNIIKLIVSENNVGMQKNGIRTLKACKGQYVAFCEGDDFFLVSNKIQIQINEMKKNEFVDMSIHYSSVMDMKTFKTYKKWEFIKNQKIYSTKDVLSESGQFASTSSFVIKRSLADKYPHIFYEELPIGDFFTELYGSLNGGILYIPYEMSCYRINVNGSWSNRYTNNPSNIKLYNYYKNMETYLMEFKNNYPQFTKEINKKMSAFSYGLSIYYLLNNDFFNFKKNINLTYKLDNDIRKFKKVIFNLRNFPILAKFTYKLKEFYKNV